MSRSRTTVFNMSRIAQSCAGDDVEALLIENIGRQFDELWPSDLRPPDALIDLSTAICTLIDWNSRTPRGKAIMRKRILKLIDALDHTAEWGPNNLAENAHALKVVPGILGAILAEEETEDLDPGAGLTLADLVEAWLAAGGDGVAEG